MVQGLLSGAAYSLIGRTPPEGEEQKLKALELEVRRSSHTAEAFVRLAHVPRVPARTG